ncbi:MAG: hypothetical protein HOH43_14660 [Candidatus Latescibacteria bacterium]|jgi:DNA-directed RNA polymerase subunit RPC12/RpoP|nr:hypothetical protein [Candidatus Latescibacterota bacterium]
MDKQYSGTFICIECGEEWELEGVTGLQCEECEGNLRAVGEVTETEA